MPEWIIAMFLIGALLSAGDMAKIFLEARRSRREAAVYDNHPQKLQMEHYADSFRVLAESFYQMPSKSVMPETGRVDKILEKEQQEVCSRCAKASWCWEQYGNLTRERCQELLQTIADGDEDEISRAKGERLLPERLPLSGTVLEPLPAGTPDGALVGACGGEPPRGGRTVK